MEMYKNYYKKKLDCYGLLMQADGRAADAIELNKNLEAINEGLRLENERLRSKYVKRDNLVNDLIYENKKLWCINNSIQTDCKEKFTRRLLRLGRRFKAQQILDAKVINGHKRENTIRKKI